MSEDTVAAATPPSKKRSRTRTIALAAAAFVLVLAGAAIWASQSGLDKALLRQQLDAFAADLAEEGKRDGRDIRFTYKDIAIVGGFTNRHAVVQSPELSIKPLTPEDKKSSPADNLIVRTEEIAIYPKAADLSELLVSMAKPIDFFDASDESRKLLTVTSDTPFEVRGREYTADKRKFLEVTHIMPASIDLNYLREQQAEGKEDATPTVVPIYEKLTITQNPGGTLHSNLAQDDSGLGEAKVALSSIVITPQVQPQGAIKIAEIKSDWKHAINEKNHHVVTAQLHIGDITADEALLPYSPIAIGLDATYEGAAPQTAQDVAAIRSQESSIKLNKFAITSKDASLSATADFVAGATDVLPVGMATISLTNTPFVLAELRKYQVLNSHNEGLVSDLLMQVTGAASVDEVKDATIDISRARGGSFTIGKTTFEEMFATILKNSMQAPAPTPADKAASPKAEEKTAPKKMTVEEGARG